MADRLAALDGALEVRSTRGLGTSVVGRLPIQTPAADRRDNRATPAASTTGRHAST